MGILVVAWLVQLTYETSIEIQLRQRGASVWRKAGRVAGLDFGRESHFEDSDIGLLTRLGGLESLDLSFTQVTSAGVEQLRSCRHLTFLSVLPEQVTPEQERRLKTELPHLMVDRIVIVDGWRVRKDFQ